MCFSVTKAIAGTFCNRKWLILNMASKVLIKNPKNVRQAWFSLPLYFGKLSQIGLTGSYDETIEIVDYEGSAFIGYGLFTVADLEQLNRQVES